ncbi:hypothetical protein LZ198_25360 [Myxococcus sp. K15C18031901]|uniref:hypothetical protein n=1 Tax=Myxococcus dinghuensis TaxID=2906761 RepID=UPI0020A717D2|nr:hypothetical protein [Myxococcus dinghuensis]MCP3102202.1 hypothetical protein [Myxococcus dinghuensis]
MFNPADIRKGMVARDRDGENLGLITRVDAGGFFVEKGAFFVRECRLAFSDVTDIDGEDVYLREDLARLPSVRPEVREARGDLSERAPVALGHDLTGALGVLPADDGAAPRH